MVDSRQKGARTETQVKDILKRYTGLNWQRVPASGALNAAHKLKGDLYIPDSNNIFCIEVKGYKDDHLTSKIITDKKSQMEEWWDQTVREAGQIGKIPLLIFKKDRGKFFVASNYFELMDVHNHMYINKLDIIICLLEDWLVMKPEFVIK